ncbi:MAG: SapB/AmfS family lanthipeptide [Pseudonocardiaceae bacterium]
MTLLDLQGMEQPEEESPGLAANYRPDGGGYGGGHGGGHGSSLSLLICG